MNPDQTAHLELSDPGPYCLQFRLYPGDTRTEFKMWGGASKSVFVLVLKICQHQFASKTLSC